MCHATTSRPPESAGGGTPAEYGPIVLRSADGTEFGAARAVPEDHDGANVVILPDVRGVHPYYETLAVEFAKEGHSAVVVDYYGRTAGPAPRGKEFDWRPHFEQVRSSDVEDDVAAAVDHLRASASAPTFIVGFCYGGGQAWRLAAADLPICGTVGFYGLPRLVDDVVDDVRHPILMILAGADAATPADEFAGLVERLEVAGAQVESHTYAGAPHSFFDRDHPEWREASVDAWRRTMEFIGRRTEAR